MLYNYFETNVIDKLLLYDNETFSILRKQFKNSEVLKREITGAGFFTNISVNKKLVKAIKANAEKIIFGDVTCMINKELFMGFILYIIDGYLTLLEGYTFDKEFTNFEIENYELRYEQGNVRKIPKELI